MQKCRLVHDYTKLRNSQVVQAYIYFYFKERVEYRLKHENNYVNKSNLEA